MKKWIVLLGAATLVAVLGFVYQANSDTIKEVAHNWFEKTPTAEQKQQPAPPSVTVIRPRQQDFVETIFVTGTLIAKEQVLVAPEVSGQRVKDLLVDIGDKVKSGQVLARLTTSNIEAQLAQFRASRARAIAARSQAEKNVEQAKASERETASALTRAKKLQRSGNISQSVYEQRLSQAQSATARLASAVVGLQVADAEIARTEAQLRELTWRQSRTEVRSPAAGVVSKRNGMVGAMTTTEPMFQIIRNGDIELNAEVSSELLSRIKVGQKAIIILPGNVEIEGSVRLMSPEIEASTRLGRVRIALGQQQAARIGAFARGRIVADRSQDLGIPATSVMYGEQGPYVLIVKNGKVAVRMIKTGLLTADRIAVKSGLSDQDIIVAKAGTFLRPGDPVTPVALDPTRLSEVK
ncbi:MAG: efflux RND transporter periplasmic adaptor subunit [Pseudomonadota bacterium]